MTTTETTEWCENCNSTGWVIDPMSLGGERPCPKCGGTGKARA